MALHRTTLSSSFCVVYLNIRFIPLTLQSAVQKEGRKEFGKEGKEGNVRRMSFIKRGVWNAQFATHSADQFQIILNHFLTFKNRCTQPVPKLTDPKLAFTTK
eukprot:EG_transcript_68344